MRLLIDDVHIELIDKAYEFYPIEGVMTTPASLAELGGNPFDVLRGIKDTIGEEDEIYVQVISRKAEDIVEEAKHIVDVLGDISTYVNIPAIPEGFKAMEILDYTVEILFAASEVYSPMQAFISAQCGAMRVVLDMNHINNAGFDGIVLAKGVQDFLQNQEMETDVLAMNFKDVQQVAELCEYGIENLALTNELLTSFTESSAVNCSMDNLVHNFENFTGKGKTMLDFE